MKNKKALFLLLFILLIFMVVGVCFYKIDSRRIDNGKDPKFTIKIAGKNGEKVYYIGFLYKITAYTGVSPKEPFRVHRGYKKGLWFSKFSKKELEKIEKTKKEKEVEKEKRIENIDEFYNLAITKDKDIRKLPQNYSAKEALKNNEAVNKIEREEINKFIERKKQGKSAFKRIFKTTTEGDLCIRDVLYYAPTNQILVVLDNSRDVFSTKEEQQIFMLEYKNLEIIKELDDFYWAVFNGEKYNPLLSSYENLILEKIEN